MRHPLTFGSTLVASSLLVSSLTSLTFHSPEELGVGETGFISLAKLREPQRLPAGVLKMFAEAAAGPIEQK